MLELTSYGLTGLAAMLVVAFCFAYGNEFPMTPEKSLNDYPMSDETDPGAIHTVSVQRDRGPAEAFHG